MNARLCTRKLNFALFFLLSGLLSGCFTEQKSRVAPETRSETLPSPGSTVQPIALARAIDIAQYQADLKQIASDEFAGRGVGEIGEQRFVPWLIAEYQKIGLEPGNAGAFTQTVPMREMTSTITQELQFVGAKGTQKLNAGVDYTLASKATKSPAVLRDSELVFMGYGVDSANERWNDYADIDVRGKTVVVLINDPGFHTGDVSLFKGKAMTYAGRWGYKFEEAARKGAAGCLIIHDDVGAAYGWEVVKNGWLRPEFELAGSAAAPTLQMHGWISAETTTKLFANAGLDFLQLRAAAGRRGFKPVSLQAKASAQISISSVEKSSQNVLGMIRGSKRPDEAIIYTAHWDHLGTNSTLAGDQIFNGAVDNATGVAALLEMARVLKVEQPERSILFMAVTLEESGLLGSRFYAENPSFALNKTVANLNMDALKLIGPSQDVEVVGFGNSSLERILEKFAAQQNRSIAPEPTPQNGFFYRSDHFNFAKVGVPALYIKTGQTHREKGAAFGAAWSDAYTRDRYHKPGDEYDANADYRGVAEDLQLLSLVGLELANRSDFPNWEADSEFRALRDAMMVPK